MRWIWMALAGAWILSGCRGTKVSPGPGRPPKTNELIVVPSTAARGRIVVVNASARYVILSYPLGQMPEPESRLAVYRHGLKVAEIKVGTQRIDTNAVADILTGECMAGDEVRGE